MPLLTIMGRDFLEKIEAEILFNSSECDVVPPTQNHRRTEYPTGITLIYLVLVCTREKFWESQPLHPPACPCTRSSAFQQLDSNTFREGKGLAYSMKVPLINKKLLPLALHKRSQELAAKHEREGGGGEWVSVKDLP